MKKFPQNIVGDFIIININHPKEEVRDITKEVLIKYIHIFGNKIFNKLKLFIDNKELAKLFQDKTELLEQYLLFKEEQNKKNFSKTKLIEINSVNNYYQNYINKNKNQKLNPIPELNNNSNRRGKAKINKNINKNNKVLIKSSSQPNYRISNKIKLKPINKANLNIKLKDNNITKNASDIREEAKN